MDVHFSEQFAFLFWSFVCGILFGAWYDVFRVARLARGGRPSGTFSPEKTLGQRSVFRFYLSHRRRLGGRKGLTGDAVLVFLEDILFFAFVIPAALILVFACNCGIPRLYSFVGMGVGFFLWRATAGRAIMLISEYICFFFGCVFFYLFFPFIFFFGKLKKVIYKALRYVYNRWEKIRDERKKRKREKTRSRAPDVFDERAGRGERYETEFQRID